MGLLAYDTHEAINKYDKGEPDVLDCATSLFLDFVNLFIRLMIIIAEIYGKSKKSEKKKW